MLKKFFSIEPISVDFAALLLRLIFGIAMLTHGIPKFMNFSERAAAFADPIGLGSTISLSLTIFAEVFCAALVVLGIQTRFALVPLIITMAVVCFMIHGDHPFAKKELSALYLAGFTALFFTGAGRYSIDAFTGKK